MEREDPNKRPKRNFFSNTAKKLGIRREASNAERGEASGSGSRRTAVQAPGQARTAGAGVDQYFGDQEATLRNVLSGAIDAHNFELGGGRLGPSSIPQPREGPEGLSQWDGASRQGTVLNLGAYGLAVRTGYDTYQYLTPEVARTVYASPQGITNPAMGGHGEAPYSHPLSGDIPIALGETPPRGTSVAAYSQPSSGSGEIPIMLGEPTPTAPTHPQPAGAGVGQYFGDTRAGLRNLLNAAVDRYNVEMGGSRPEAAAIPRPREGPEGFVEWDGANHRGAVLNLGAYGLAVHTGRGVYQHVSTIDAERLHVTSHGISQAPVQSQGRGGGRSR